MTEGIEQRHFSDGAIILEKVLGFTAFSTPKVAWGRASSFAGGATPAY